MSKGVLYVSSSESCVQGHMIKKGEIVNVQSLMHNIQKPSLVSFNTRLGACITMELKMFDKQFKLERGM